jgi:galactokinase
LLTNLSNNGLMLVTIRSGHIGGQSDAACGETPTEYGRSIAVPVSRILRVLTSPDEYRWFRAPGRVNLMGDHTDYNEGLVLPIAIGLECVVAARPRDDGDVSLRSLDEVEDDWTRYVDAVREVIAPARGIDGVLASSVPPGSGLSSSAALEVAVARALGGDGLAPVELALACQRAEHLATGVPSGVMDQLASVAARADHALLIDCRSLELRHVRIPENAAIVVVHSGVPRTLEQSAYAERRAECDRIARRLGLRSLRDAVLDQVLDEPLGRHVVTENTRVEQTAEALEHGDLRRVGELMRESHASLRDDYAVSTSELDALIELLESAGAHGARLTGAGFGGCVVAIASRAAADRILETAKASYELAWVVRASNGAGQVQPCNKR